MCIPSGSHLVGKTDNVESANLVKTNQVIWPCPPRQPSLFYPSGTPVSASLSSAPATRNTAPEGGQEKGETQNIYLTGQPVSFGQLLSSHILQHCKPKRHMMLLIANDTVLHERGRAWITLDEAELPLELYLYRRLQRDSIWASFCSNTAASLFLFFDSV